MILADVRDYIETLEITKNVYSGKLDAKVEKSIGVYNSKHNHPYTRAIGRKSSYGVKYITLLVHWTKLQRETEKAAKKLFKALENTREQKINDKKIKFIQLLCNEPISVDTDENGIYEMAIEAAVVYEKGE